MRRHAFSFAEVLFAVFILGIGFIMVAAVFPVAAQQTISTADEAVAAALAREAVNTIRTATVPGDFVPGNSVATFDNVWAKVSDSVIDASDSRYAWMPFFYSPSEGPVQVTILVVRRRIHDQYVPLDYSSHNLSATLSPRSVSISISLQPDGTRHVDILPGGTPDVSQCVAQGTYLIINNAEYHGKVLRVGQFISAASGTLTYQLDPVGGLDPDDADSFSTTAFIVGRDYKNAYTPESQASNYNPVFDGPVQDVSVFTTFLSPS